jgi:LuxR family maltose regulon positive regulatory protein
VPAPVLDARPSLLVMFATALSVAGYLTQAEQKLRAAEAAMVHIEPDEATQNLSARIVSMRSLLALMAGDPQEIESLIAQSRQSTDAQQTEALRFKFGRSNAVAHWKLGLAHQLQGNRDEARAAHIEAVIASEATANAHVMILATTCLGRMEEYENKLALAVETYQRVLVLVGEPPGPVACEAHVGLARIHYDWNDLDAAQRHGQLSAQLARQIEISNFVPSEVFLSRLMLAQGDSEGAAALLAKTDTSVREGKFWARVPELTAARIQVLLHQGSLAEAALLAESHDLPFCRARVHLAQGDPSAAMAVLKPWRHHVEARGWIEEQLGAMVLEAITYHALDQLDSALRVLGEVLALAEPAGRIRLFLDEGKPMVSLLTEAVARGIKSEYAGQILAFSTPGQSKVGVPTLPDAHLLVEPLSPRELEVLQLIAQGLSNRDIADRLFVALDTVKGHNRKIFGKLDVQSRTEALARARELHLLT